MLARRSRGPSDDASAESADEPRAPLSLRHPGRALAVAAILIVVLSAFGFSLEDRLSPSSLDIPGTRTEQANAMLREHFGDSAIFAILLEGPAGAIDRQGPDLVRALRREQGVTTVSPWDRGATAAFRPTPNRALIVADFHVDTDTAVKDKVPLVDEVLEDEVHPPVEAIQTGGPTLTATLASHASHGATGVDS